MASMMVESFSFGGLAAPVPVSLGPESAPSSPFCSSSLPSVCFLILSDYRMTSSSSSMGPEPSGRGSLRSNIRPKAYSFSSPASVKGTIWLRKL